MATFKKPKGSFRKRRESFSSDEDSEATVTSSSVEETKELQKLRKRQKGINIEDLAAGHITKKEEKGNVDPLKLKTGGFVDIKTLKKEIIANVEDMEQIGTSFAAETNRRDEDADMVKYVEEELAKAKGHTQEDMVTEERSKNATDALYELPDHIKNITSSNKKTEDMLSNQMLSGIPEIDLGIDVKIKNIEVTEEAKQKLLDERRKKKHSGVSNFVPTNMAVNFVQHNRFNIEDSATPKHIKREPPAPKPAPLRVGDMDRPTTIPEPRSKKSTSEKATDDFYFERFKKQVRKY